MSHFKITSGTLLGTDDSQLEELLGLARKLSKQWQDPEVVILVQAEPVKAFGRSFFDSLTQDLLRCQFKRRLLKIRLLLRLIRKSPSFWIYVSDSECLGLYSEMALACKMHFCTSSRLKFGFPEIYSGVFPFGGVLESLCRANNRLIETWKNAPTKIIQKGDPLVEIVFISNHDVLPIIGKILEKKFPKNVAPMKADLVIDWYEDQISNDRHDEEPSGATTRNHWQDAVEVIRRGGSKSAVTHWLVEATASYIFTHAFLSSMSKFFSMGQLESYQSRVFIDVSQAIIDPYPFAEILNSRAVVVISCLDRNKLLRSLEVLYLGLERQGDKRLLDYWNQNVFWLLGQVPQGVDFIRYCVDRTIDFGYKGKAWKGWLLSSGQSHPHLVAIPSGPAETSDILYSIGFRGVNTPNLNTTVFIRSWVLEEVLRIAPLVGGIDAILQELQLHNWGFIAKESRWEFFLRHRHFDDLLVKSIGTKTLDEEVWELASWGLVVRYSASDSQESMSLTKLSEHFFVMAIVIFSTLAREMTEISHREVAILVSATLGVPKSFALPLPGTNPITARRWGQYIDTHWPDQAIDYFELFR